MHRKLFQVKHHQEYIYSFVRVELSRLLGMVLLRARKLVISMGACQCLSFQLLCLTRPLCKAFDC